MKKLGLALCTALALMTPVASFAVPLAHVAPGQIYDYDTYGITNPRAQVLDVSGGSVLIQIIQGPRRGEMLWVHPSLLLTMDQSAEQETTNAVATGIIALMLICAMAGPECTDG